MSKPNISLVTILHDNITFLDDGFIWTSEKDGFNHIYQFYYNTKEMKQITKGDYEITNFYGYNDKKNFLIKFIIEKKWFLEIEKKIIKGTNILNNTVLEHKCLVVIYF